VTTPSSVPSAAWIENSGSLVVVVDFNFVLFFIVRLLVLSYISNETPRQIAPPRRTHMTGLTAVKLEVKMLEHGQAFDVRTVTTDGWFILLLYLDGHREESRELWLRIEPFELFLKKWRLLCHLMPRQRLTMSAVAPWHAYTHIGAGLSRAIPYSSNSTTVRIVMQAKSPVFTRYLCTRMQESPVFMRLLRSST
jgi:hypothetical protein